MKKDHSHIIGLVCLIITIILFSTFEVTSKFLSPCMRPTQITFTRFLIGGLILLPFTMYKMKQKNIRLSQNTILYIALLGFLNIVVSMGLIQLGLVYANASVSAVLFSINPLFVVLFAKPLLGEHITINKVLGLLLGLLGVSILFMDSITKKTSTLYGLLLILGAALCFALYSVVGKKVMNRNSIGSLEMTTFSFLFGSILMVPLQLAIGVPLIPKIQNVLPQLLYMSVVVTGIAYVLYFEGLSRLDAGAGSMLYFAKPALAALLAALILKETLSIHLVIGIIIIAVGILISQFMHCKQLKQ